MPNFAPFRRQDSGGTIGRSTGRPVAIGPPSHRIGLVPPGPVGTQRVSRGRRADGYSRDPVCALFLSSFYGDVFLSLCAPPLLLTAINSASHYCSARLLATRDRGLAGSSRVTHVEAGSRLFDHMDAGTQSAQPAYKSPKEKKSRPVSFVSCEDKRIPLRTERGGAAHPGLL